MIAVPIGVFTAIYLVEYGRGAVARAVSFMVDILTGVPSIVAALFIYAVWVTTFGFQRVGFAVCLALVLLMLPVVVRSTEEMLKLVPNELREASYALGVPKWVTIVRIVLPTAFSGIVTGILLGLARIIGRDGSAAHPRPLHQEHRDEPLLRPDAHPPDDDQPGPDRARHRRRGRADVGHRPHAHPHRPAAQRRRPPRGAPQHGPRLTRIRQRTRKNLMAKRIDVKDLNVYYGDFKAVEGVSLTVEPRSVTAFIGPSGCGKSTFLRTLNRMHEVVPGGRVEGQVMLDDKDLYASSVDPVSVRRTVGMVFQRPNPFPTMSIYDNVVSGLRLSGMKDKKALAEAAEKSLVGANLWNEVKDRLKKPGAGLSGGQQQRLCIARAIAVKPQVLLMDEPCSALDPISTLAIEDLVSELKTDYTIVIVTHNMQQASRVSDRTAFFNLAATGKPGRLIEIDTTQKIFSNPKEQATEDYISGRFG